MVGVLIGWLVGVLVGYKVGIRVTNHMDSTRYVASVSTLSSKGS